VSCELFLSLVLSLLLLPSTVAFTGPVVSVLDGDTIEVLHSNRPVRIRLNGIDCPKNGQAYGKRAASALVFGNLHPPNPGAPRHALSQARPQGSLNAEA
jgi:hypothetical protein